MVQHKVYVHEQCQEESFTRILLKVAQKLLHKFKIPIAPRVPTPKGCDKRINP